nr:hypothetical protein [Tanacetum cinerariifolium]
ADVAFIDFGLGVAGAKGMRIAARRGRVVPFAGMNEEAGREVPVVGLVLDGRAQHQLNSFV